jgi:formate/nitrite transporter FocA (FNT family)
MNCWLRRLIAVIQIGGGFMGIIITLQALANGDKDSLYITSNIVFAMFFVLGIAAGAALLESAPLGLFLSKIFQLIQIPVISSPFFQY